MMPRQRSNGTLIVDIDGAVVRCEPLGQSRLWHCDCAYFERMRVRYAHGFCPHVAVAIEQAAMIGWIDLEKPTMFR